MNTLMKNTFPLIIFFILQTLLCNSQSVGINDDASTPNSSAMLDIKSASKGMLIPRIALTSTSTAAPVTSPETSLMIYNTATAGDVTAKSFFDVLGLV